MRKPDTLIAKYFFLIFIGLLVFFIFSIIMWILNLSGRCRKSKPNNKTKDDDEENNKKNYFIIYLLIFIVICSMAAQAVNQSYTKIIQK